VSGLWHGAAWTYIIWGALNGVYLVVGHVKGRLGVQMSDWVSRSQGTFAGQTIGLITQVGAVACTFGLICVGWIFFRAQSLADAWYILTHLGMNWDWSRIGTEQFLLRQMPVALGAIALLEMAQWLHGRRSLALRFAQLRQPLRWTAYASAVLGTVMFGVYRKTEFIYFQF
jgi:D-alanyl-lipoteichoic acid acyltransferase DltB (MBOAT superfamily)